jgi:hypothetical protein
LEQIKQRSLGCTPGPWIHEGPHVVLRDGQFRVHVAQAGWNDAEFIANAPEDVAWLIRQLEQLTPHA